MVKPQGFLKGYNTILLDMDGVITSEQRYWDAAALTIYEYLNKRISPTAAMANKEEIRKQFLHGDKIIKYLKNVGVNSNWDIAYVTLSAAFTLNETTDFGAVYKYLKEKNLSAPALYESIGEQSPLGKRGGEGYNSMISAFQEWYLGDELFLEQWRNTPGQGGKEGLIHYEQPLVPLDNIKSVLSALKGLGISIGIGTGRVNFEARLPLKLWDIEKYFDEDKIITYTEVMQAEKATGVFPLAKPHKYTFIKGMLGKNFEDGKIVREDYDKSSAPKTLVVGDAGADILSAKDGGMDFAAVLTGISGHEAKDYFLSKGADYIFDDITGLVEGIEKEKSGKDNC